jgi:hypothetical protein
MSLLDPYGIASAAVILAVLVVGGISWLRERRRPERQDGSAAIAAPPGLETRSRAMSILRRHWVSVFVIGLAAILLLVHLSHGVYVAGVLLLGAVVWSIRAQAWRDAWRNDSASEDP